MENQIKRTTLMVRDMERSLEFFRDVLGAKVWFDRPYTLDGTGIPIGKKGDVIRLSIVQFEHDEIGMIGLMEFKDPVMPAPEIDYNLGYGKPVFVVTSKDAKGIYKRATEKGFKTRSEPVVWNTIGAKGETKHFISANLWDGDGHFFECNEVTHIDWPEGAEPR